MRSFITCLYLLFSCTAFANAHRFLAQGLAVEAGPPSAPLKARLYAIEASPYRSVLFLNPGGLIPALAMSGLAEAFAAEGDIVFVLDNPGDLPIQAVTLAPDLAAAFRSQAPIRGLPPELSDATLRNLPFRALGHSLGGAVLGAEIGNPSSLFQSIILIGVSRLVSTPAEARMKLTFLLGDKDGLASRAGVEELAAKFQTRAVLLPGVNHFCIISDPKAGAPDKRAQDLPTDLSSDECLARVVAAANR